MVWWPSISTSPDRAHRQIEEPVAGDLLDHVREERQRRLDVGLARSVEIELDDDLGFACLSRDFGGAAHGRPIARKEPFWRAAAIGANLDRPCRAAPGDRGRTVGLTASGGCARCRPKTFSFTSIAAASCCKTTASTKRRKSSSRRSSSSRATPRVRTSWRSSTFASGLYPRAIEIYEELIRDFPQRRRAHAEPLALLPEDRAARKGAHAAREPGACRSPSTCARGPTSGSCTSGSATTRRREPLSNAASSRAWRAAWTTSWRAAAPPRSLSVPPPGPTPHAPTPRRIATPTTAEAFHDLEREVTLAGIHRCRADRQRAPAPRDPSERPALPVSGAERSSAAPARPKMGRRLIPCRAHQYRSAAIGAGRDQSRRTPERARRRLARLTHSWLARSFCSFRQSRGSSLHPSGLVLVRVESSFAARLSRIQLLAADAPAVQDDAAPQRRMRNRTLDEPLGGAETPLVSLGGAGYLALAPARGRAARGLSNGRRFSLRARRRCWPASKSTLTYENGRLAAFEGEAVALVQLRGTRRVSFCAPTASS